VLGENFVPSLKRLCCNLCRIEVPDYFAPAGVGSQMADGKAVQFLRRSL